MSFKLGLKINGVYEHYKGKNYKVMDVVKHSETLEDLVLYECLYENDLGKIWVRPIELFTGSLEIKGVESPRFKLKD